MEVITFTGKNNQKIINRVSRALLDKKLVILPTDTVYGVMALATDTEAVVSLYKAKGRNLSKPTALLVSSLSEAKKIIEDNLTEKLGRIFWPGALTIINKAKIDIFQWPKLGIRVPNEPFLLKVLKVLKQPLMASSANLAGEIPPTDLSQVPGKLAKSVDIAVDKGRVRGGEASTVIEIKDNSFKMLRSGPITSKQIKEALAANNFLSINRQSSTINKVLFVCAGNTCRSPMAEVMFNNIARQFKLDVYAESAGLMVCPGSLAATNAKLIMLKKGIDLYNHRSRCLEDVDLNKVDLILTMESSQLEVIPDQFKKKAYLFSRYASSEGKDIVDPIGGDTETYRACARIIEKHLKNLFKKI